MIGTRDRHSSIESDALSPAQPLSSPSISAVQDLAVAARDNTDRLEDEDGSLYSPSIPASFAEPFEFSHPLRGEKTHGSPPTRSETNQRSPIPRLHLDTVDSDPAQGSPRKSPAKKARTSKVTSEKRGRQPERATAPSKRRRVQGPVKKRVVQPRPKAKTMVVRTQEKGSESVAHVAETHESQPAATTEAPRINNRTTLASETGSPDETNPPRASASPTKGRTDAPGSAEIQPRTDSPNREVPNTQPAVDLKPVFQTQPRKSRAETSQTDSPQRPKADAVAKIPSRCPPVPAAQNGQRGSRDMGVKRPTDKTTATGSTRHVLPVALAQKEAAFEAFHQHIMGQLTMIEASEQHDQPDKNTGAEVSPNKKASMTLASQHMLGGVLNTVMEVSSRVCW